MPFPRIAGVAGIALCLAAAPAFAQQPSGRQPANQQPAGGSATAPAGHAGIGQPDQSTAEPTHPAGSASNGDHTSGQSSNGNATSANDNRTMTGHGPADQAMLRDMQTMRQRMNDAHMTGKPDQDFVTLMIPHHEAAVAMAKTELKYGKSSTLKKMARKVIENQEFEIREMKDWKAKYPNEQ